MKKYLVFLFIILLVSSCGTVTYSTIYLDQMFPASLQFPPGIKKIGLIDRLALTKENQPSNPIGLNSGQFTQLLATKISNSDYFDDVILCDSDVSQWDRTQVSSISPLSREHVQDLCEDLGVDMIVSTERSYAKLLTPDPIPVIYGEAVLRLYLPSRTNPLKTILQNDTIYWQADNIALLGTSTIYNSIRVDVENYLAEKCANYLTPHWGDMERAFYSYGNADMRDGAYFVNQGDWEKAEEIWTEACKNAKGKLKLQYEYNLAFCKEMLGDVDGAYQMISELEGKSHDFSQLYFMVLYYKSVLAARVNEVQLLNLQLKRFE